MSIRIEQFDGGEVVYIALDPDGTWARSDFPSELLTLDYNAQGGLIGLELVGSLAQRAATAMVGTLLEESEVSDLKEKLAPVFG